MQNTTQRITNLAVIVAFFLLTPFAATQFSDAVVWTLSDFVIAGALLFGAGLVYIFATKNVSKKGYRVVIGLLIAALLLLIWAELAVGVFGSPWAGS